MPLKWLQDSPRLRWQHTKDPFLFARATRDHSEALVHKAHRAACGNTVLQNTLPGSGHPKLIVAGSDGHLALRPPTWRTLGTVAHKVQISHALTHRGHRLLGTANSTAYDPPWDVTEAAKKDRALRAREGQTSVQSSHSHAGRQKMSRTNSQLLWPHYHQALLPGDKALCVSSWRSPGAEQTEVFCLRPVPDAAEAQLRKTAGYNSPGGGPPWTSSLSTCSGPGTLLGSCATTRWSSSSTCLTALRPGRRSTDFVAFLLLANDTLECPAQEDPHTYRPMILAAVFSRNSKSRQKEVFRGNDLFF